MKKIKFMSIVFTILFFSVNLYSQESINNPFTKQNVVFSEQQKMWVKKSENIGHLLEVKNNWWNIKSYQYNVHQNVITSSPPVFTVLYYLILLVLLLICFNTSVNTHKWERKSQIGAYVYLICFSCLIGFIADASPDITMGWIITLMIGVALSLAALVFNSIYTAFASFLLTLLVGLVSSEIGFMACFKEIILPLMVCMTLFMGIKLVIDYRKNSKRITSLDL